VTDYQALLDFDGLLADMSPFAGELADPEDPNRWMRFFAHTVDAKPMDAGVELVAALGRIGVRWSLSTTRARCVTDRSSGAPVRIPQGPVIREWVGAHLGGARPRTVFMRRGNGSQVEIKRQHFAETALQSDRKPLPAVLFVDDEIEIVDALCAAGIPAMHVEDFAGLPDADLVELLEYSRKQLDSVTKSVEGAQS
jgi:hypothetical protein